MAVRVKVNVIVRVIVKVNEMKKYVVPQIKNVSLRAAGDSLLFTSGNEGTIPSGNDMEIEFEEEES